MNKKREPFSVLVEMANKSLRQTEGLPAQQEATETWTGVAFKLAGQNMVAPMAEVGELLHVPGWTSMPGTALTSFEGRLM